MIWKIPWDFLGSDREQPHSAIFIIKIFQLFPWILCLFAGVNKLTALHWKELHFPLKIRNFPQLSRIYFTDYALYLNRNLLCGRHLLNNLNKKHFHLCGRNEKPNQNQFSSIFLKTIGFSFFYKVFSSFSNFMKMLLNYFSNFSLNFDKNLSIISVFFSTIQWKLLEVFVKLKNIWGFY